VSAQTPLAFLAMQLEPIDTTCISSPYPPHPQLTLDSSSPRRTAPRSRDAAGRFSLPLDQTEGHAPEPWHAHLALPCVAPPFLVDAPAGRGGRGGGTAAGGVLAGRDVVRALLAALSGGAAPLQQQLCLLALGHCSKEHYVLLAQVRVDCGSLLLTSHLILSITKSNQKSQFSQPSQPTGSTPPTSGAPPAAGRVPAAQQQPAARQEHGPAGRSASS
jgi:hypothetical protein